MKIYVVRKSQDGSPVTTHKVKTLNHDHISFYEKFYTLPPKVVVKYRLNYSAHTNDEFLNTYKYKIQIEIVKAEYGLGIGEGTFIVASNYLWFVYLKWRNPKYRIQNDEVQNQILIWVVVFFLTTIFAYFKCNNTIDSQNTTQQEQRLNKK